MSKYSKGPWHTLPEEADKDYIRIRGTLLGGRYKIANVPTPTYQGVHERELEETRANARLIASAPELLEALIRARRCLAWASEQRPEFESEYDFANSAIAKATGEA